MKPLLAFFLPAILTISLCAAEPVPRRAGIVLEEFVYTKADFPQCHAATVIELVDGTLLCAFFGGTKEGDPDVEIRLCRKPVGGAWTPPISVADGIQPGGEKRFATFNPVLFQPAGGDLILFYKVHPRGEHWLGEFKTSRDGGRTWSSAHKLEDGFIGPDRNKPIQLSDGTIIAPSAIEDKQGWRVHVERSTDGGKTWTKIGPLNDSKQFKAIQPAILTHADGRLQMLMRVGSEAPDTKIVESWSSDGGVTWTPFAKTSLPNNNSGLDAVTLKDGRHLLVYNHSTRLQPGMGHKGRGVLNIALSKDGVNWEAALVLDYLDEKERQFSYPAVIQSRDGLVHIVYTWHRRRIKHVVLDPAKLVTHPIVDGQWPAEKIPLVKSPAPDVEAVNTSETTPPPPR